MKRIGIIGGLSAESTASYYLAITREYVRQYGNFAYPEILIYSVNFQRFLDWQNVGQWDLTTERIVEIFHVLAEAGAQIGLIATNTLHYVFDDVEPRSPIPLISIVSATTAAVQQADITTVGLLGTHFTTEGSFYQRALTRAGITTLVPDTSTARAQVHAIIVNELARGEIKEDSHQAVIDIAARLIAQGAQGLILGCTELPLLLKPQDLAVTMFNTAEIHALAALDAAKH